jgi:hypothetical protein
LAVQSVVPKYREEGRKEHARRGEGAERERERKREEEREEKRTKMRPPLLAPGGVLGGRVVFGFGFYLVAR